MAEVVGLAASIAGLLAITGQIGKSILFIKGFLEDTKNAPEEIRSLACEIELLSSAAKKTDTLLVKCQADGLDIDLEEEKKGLTRYADMIEKLKVKIEKDVNKFGPGKGHWWERVGSAARKKSVEGYLVGVERAKTLVLGIETTVIIQLQHEHRDSLSSTGQSLETLRLSSDGHTMTLNKMETKTTQISAWTGTTDQTLATLSTEVQQINTSINNLVPVIQNLKHQSTPQPELSALESMLESAVMRGMKQHHEELQNSQPISSHPVTKTLEIPESYTNTSSEDNSQPLYSESYAMLRRDKIVFQTAFRTPLFDIEIETKEAQRIPKPRKGTSVQELSRLNPTHSQRFTTYKVRVKIPFWRGGMTFCSGNAGMMYGGSLCKTFRTCNFVPSDAPIMEACKIFDCSEVRRLFEAGLASPLDLDYDRGLSLVDTILRELALTQTQKSRYQAAIDLLKYLIYCLNGDIGRVWGLVDILMLVSISLYSKETLTAFAEGCRLALAHCSHDPVASIEQYLTIRVSKTPVYQVLIAQDRWWLDDGLQYGETEVGEYWTETDLHMLKDPCGLSLKAALDKNIPYRPFNVRDFYSDHHPVHALLTIASDTMEEEFHKCVHSRLVILLENGLDPRSIHHSLAFFQEGQESMTDRPLSCTEYAQFLGLSGLWKEALEGAGWSIAEIDFLFEEDMVLAMTALLSGEIQYRSRDDNRRNFVQAVRRGEFADLKKEAISSLAFQLEIELGLARRCIKNLIGEVNAIFRERKIPGSWLDEGDISLIPGKDFRLRYDSLNKEQMKDWQYIREIWEEELGGCIPEGYAGNGYDYDMKQWV
ncbi:hypothetical protein DL98DRAFT_590269 [Cadophora sp. DSE1049]|nr:hypothetical protein DL98DRAFT_590269 [Cadophora sp. DSE1049]